MSDNKRTIENYIEGFQRSDHAKVLSCLTDDVVWDIPGFVHLEGKDAFDGEIENPAFVAKPEIVITRMTEENDVVAVEGTVRAQRADGTIANLLFCDIFEMSNAKIKHLTSYLMEVK